MYRLIGVTKAFHSVKVLFEGPKEQALATAKDVIKDAHAAESSRYLYIKVLDTTPGPRVVTVFHHDF